MAAGLEKVKKVDSPLVLMGFIDEVLPRLWMDI